MVLILIFKVIATLLVFVDTVDAHWNFDITSSPTRAINNVSHVTRAFWMRRANAALLDVSRSPCPFLPFGSVVVNHTSGEGIGEEVCIGANSGSKTGNPILHGEIAAIINCTTVLTDPNGRYRLSPKEALEAFPKLSFYTNAESCPMCASAIRWSGFREYIYGTSIDALIVEGWGQIRVPSIDIFRESFDFPYQSRLLGGLLANETDPLFQWQFNPDAACPLGCQRDKGGCEPSNG
ncbi:guanine deaminase [Pseudovirgaria hyperparasitica]|uniref:Guanine deaminase n=1 Tax=Pseudovirgaria hyperparasitica TaxID=470096 RepID=A0A6A6W5W3_9PEZI|nr:guanine deaminase [Pseudovirgaria hyperparasitica]KAF2758318.1 guanine deaminase [Pseudovirgaria hyperparasitica]